ncbi:MAG: SDR family oxidoreductase [Microbacteriaceae bacterium]|nr:MAG: SDR family oxidoreductase [Microbacteriaceae bacterium]
MTINGSVALVTGAARGMGRATVDALLTAGASKVFAVDRAEAEYADERVIPLVIDVSDETALKDVFARAPEAIQVVVNCAGIYRFRDGLDISLDAWNESMRINLVAPFLIMKYASARLVDERLDGAFVNVASIAGKRGFSNQADYCAAKAGLIGLTRAAALDLAPHGITVNAVAPGTVDTPMMSSVVSDLMRTTGLSEAGQRGQLTKDIPIGRMQTAAEVAAAIAFLTSAPARAITGETLVVDGGLTRD